MELTKQNITNVSDNVPRNVGIPLTSYGDVITPEGNTVAVQNGTCPSLPLEPWKNDWKTELNSHAVTAYCFLAEISIGKEKYSRALRLMKIALLCLGMNPNAFSVLGVCQYFVFIWVYTLACQYTDLVRRAFGFTSFNSCEELQTALERFQKFSTRTICLSSGLTTKRGH